MRDKILEKLAYWQVHQPIRVLIVFLICTAIMTYFASSLKTTMRWSDLLPENDPRTKEFDRVIQEFSTASSIVILVQGEENQIKKFADAIAPEIKKITRDKTNEPLIQRVDYKQEVSFLKKYALLLTKESDLKNNLEMFTNPNVTDFITNLNNALEKEYVGKEESISTREKRDKAIYFVNGLYNWLHQFFTFIKGEKISDDEIKASIDEITIGDPYFISYDQSTLLLNVVPTFSSVELDKVIEAVNKVEKIVKEKSKNFPGITAGLTGTLTLSRDEMEASQRSLNETSIISLLGIFLLMIFTFRMWMAPFLALGTLVVGILWAMGTAYLSVGILNIMTSMMAVILMGLGIDFSIHILSSFTEARESGKSISDALFLSYKKSGKGIITGALTTSAAFLCLVISHSRGMKEMGIVTSLGLLTILLVTFVLLPTLLVLREKRREKKGGIKFSRDISYQKLGKFAETLSQKKLVVFILFIILTIFFGYHALHLRFDYNYLNMEPKGLKSISLQDTLLNKFDLSMDYALIVAHSVEESRTLAKQAKELSTVALVEDISAYVPSPKEQKQRIPLIQSIKKSVEKSSIRTQFSMVDLQNMITQLKRLEMNIMEIQDLAYLQGEDRLEQICAKIVGSPDQPNSISWLKQMYEGIEKNKIFALKQLEQYQRIFAPYFKKGILRMCNVHGIQLKDIPKSILARYANNNLTQFLVTIYPKENIWKDSRYLKNFTLDVQSVSQRATGMAPIMQALYDIIGRDGRHAMFLTLVIVFLLLWADFRKIHYAVLAMIPLLAGLIWMTGIMRIFGMMLTVVNVMGLPMILGIGIDDGVHILHRFHEEQNKNIFTIFSSTGKAILLTSLTTMLAFGSLVFSIYRGFASLGSAMAIGVGACFLTTILGIAPILGFLKGTNHKNE